MSAANNAAILHDLNAAVAADRPVVLATIVATRRSVPRHAGTKMLVYADGTTSGTIGGGAMEAKVVAEALHSLENGKIRLLDYELVNPNEGDPGICGGELTVYLEPYMPAHTVFVIGCGHVGRTVVELAHWLGYRTIAVDDRPDQVSEEAMPLADFRFAGSVADAIDQHQVTKDTSIVVVTRSPELDAEIIPALLDTPARYIGVMGSAKRWRSTRSQLVAAGVDEAVLERVRVPIGIELNAETLQEIAVSILSEVIRDNRGDKS